jgi:hypothetical protein
VRQRSRERGPLRLVAGAPTPTSRSRFEVPAVLC